MGNPYIEFIKQNPRIEGESAQERIKRLAELWKQYKNQKEDDKMGYIIPSSQPINIPKTDFYNPHGYKLYN
jgi:hypothetical protein